MLLQPFDSAFCCLKLFCSTFRLITMDTLMEAATVRLGSLGWMDQPAEFAPWLMVGVMLFGLMALAGCRHCFGTRQTMATEREETTQDLLKQNLARSLAPAQVQAWVDAMAPITGTVDDSMVRMHSKLEEVAGQILETMAVQVKNFGEKQLAEIRAQFVQLTDAISDVAKAAALVGCAGICEGASERELEPGRGEDR